MIFVQQDPSLSDLWRKKDLDLFSLSEADPPLFFVKCISFKALSFPPTDQTMDGEKRNGIAARASAKWRVVWACT